MPLDEAERRELDGLVTALTDAIREVIAQAAVDEPVCSICLAQGQEPDLDALPPVFAGRRADRDRLLAEGG